MHYCLALITTKFPTDKIIEERLKPYEGWWVRGESEEDAVETDFAWDKWYLGGRYRGLLKLKAGQLETEYKWEYGCTRNNRLFRSVLMDWLAEAGIGEESCFNELGIDDGYIRVDACRIRDLFDKEGIKVHCLLDVDNAYYARQRWNGKAFIKNANFEKEMLEVLNKRDDCYISIIDFYD